MRHITIPRDVSSDAQRAFQQVNREMQRVSIPLLQDMTSVRGISEGSSAYFVEDDGTVCRYTKINNKLYRQRLEAVDG